MSQTVKRWVIASGICLLLAAASPQAFAADQVLSCATDQVQGPDAQVLISEGMMSRGRILWPSQSGTMIYQIMEKTAVSYLAATEDKAAPQKPNARLYINRLNGSLSLQLPISKGVGEILAQLCHGKISRDECATRQADQASGQPAMCFASIDCAKLGIGNSPFVEATYKCRRSFKKF